MTTPDQLIEAWEEHLRRNVGDGGQWDFALQEWMAFREEYDRELLEHELSKKQ